MQEVATLIDLKVIELNDKVKVAPARTGSQAYDAKHMEGGGGRSGEVADWSRPGSSWRRIDKKLGGRTEEPRGVATCQNCPQREVSRSTCKSGTKAETSVLWPLGHYHYASTSIFC